METLNTRTTLNLFNEVDKTVIEKACKDVIEVFKGLTDTQKSTALCVLVASYENMTKLDFVATLTAYKFIARREGRKEYGPPPTKQEILSNRNLTEEAKAMLLDMIEDGR